MHTKIHLSIEMIEYNKGVEQIKSAGFKVYRNSVGKHKIVIPK